MEPKHDPYVTPETAAAEYNTSEVTLRRMVRRGNLHRYKSIQDNRRTLYARAELDRLYGPEGRVTPVELIAG